LQVISGDGGALSKSFSPSGGFFNPNGETAPMETIGHSLAELFATLPSSRGATPPKSPGVPTAEGEPGRLGTYEEAIQAAPASPIASTPAMEPYRPGMYDAAIEAALDKLPDRHPAGASASRFIHSTRRADRWTAGIYSAYQRLLLSIRDASEGVDLERLLEETLKEGPDFLKVRREAGFAPVPVVAFNKKAAAEIMKQARLIEQQSYLSHPKGQHGGCIGRMGMQLLEWFCYVMWPRATFGLFPSLAYIAAGARMSRESVSKAIKTLEAYGFLTVIARRKRIHTAFGLKQVQDTNGYVLNLAKGWGSLALKVFGKAKEQNTLVKSSNSHNKYGQSKASESTRSRATKRYNYNLKPGSRKPENISNGVVIIRTP
jgi:hypothetical protein